MSRTWNVAIVGAGELLGAELLQLLEARDFPVGTLRLLGTGGIEEEFLEFRGEEVLVEKLDREAFGGIDIALFGTGADIAREFCPVAAAGGSVCIDAGADRSAEPETPLAAPGFNPGALTPFGSQGIIASPGGVALQLLAVLHPLRSAGLRRVVVSTYQAVSGSGREAVDELRLQAGDLLNGRPAEARTYPHPIAFNCLPQVGRFEEGGATGEEAGIARQVGRVLGEGSPAFSITAVRVPVFFGDGAAVHLETERPLPPAAARRLLEEAPGVRVVDDPGRELYPLASDGAGEEAVLVGRIRADLEVRQGLSLWNVADGLRLRALNAVRIAEVLATGRG